MAASAPRPDWQFQLLDLKPSRPTPTLVPPPPPVEPGESAAMRQLRASLGTSLSASMIAKVRSGAELLRSTANSGQTAMIPTTLEAIDTLLGGGLRRGKLLELVSRRASGRFSIVLSAITAATTMGEAVALIDLGDHFDPRRAEEMITATGFQLVIVDVGLHPIRGRRAPEAAWVRLARTAESHGTAMLVSSPYPLTGIASEAVLKGSFTRARWLGRGNAPRLLESIEMNVTLEKHRHLKPGASASVALRFLE